MTLVVVARLLDMPQAQVAASALRSADLHPVLLDEQLNYAIWTSQFAWGCRVAVPESEAEDARAISSTDANGTATTDCGADYPITVQVACDGFEPAKFDFVKLSRSDLTELKLKHAKPMSGVVFDKATGKPIDGAAVRIAARQRRRRGRRRAVR